MLYAGGGTTNNTFNNITLSGGANVLVVELTNRNGSGNQYDLPQGNDANLTYGGQFLQAAALAEGAAANYDNVGIYYLYNPPTGVADSLVVNFPYGTSDTVIDAYTLGGANTTLAPITSTGTSDSYPSSMALTVAGVAAGSWAAEASTIRLGSAATSSTATISGPASGGAWLSTVGNGGSASTGHLWSATTPDLYSSAGLAANLSAGSFTWTESANGTANVHWDQALAVFAPAAGSAFTWTGTAGSGGNANWNTTDANWSGAGTIYADSSTATFPDGPTNTNITIAAGGVSPYHVNFTNSTAVYSLSGGPIAGSAGITLSGGGLVKLNNTNSYAGATDITSGTLQIGQANALPTATGVLLGGANGVLDLHGNNLQVGSLSGPGTVTNLGIRMRR